MKDFNDFLKTIDGRTMHIKALDATGKMDTEKEPWSAADQAELTMKYVQMYSQKLLREYHNWLSNQD